METTNLAPRPTLRPALENIGQLTMRPANATAGLGLDIQLCGSDNGVVVTTRRL
jgi:hypothetical protein